MIDNHALLMNFVEKFLGTVRFGNNDFAVIAGYGDVGLKVAFRKSTCFVRKEDGVDLLSDDRSSNLYTIALNEVASNSSTYLLAKVSSSQSWLWHQHRSHLNFATINNLVKNNLVQGLPKMKFEKDHLCSACEFSQVDEASKKDLEDLFQDFFDEYFDSSKIMKSSTTNVESSNVEVPLPEEEVFHEVSESFQGESSLSSLNDDVQQSPEEIMKSSTTNVESSNVEVPSPEEEVFHEDFTLFQMDVKISFLNEILKEEVKQYPDHMYARDKALYGLKQVPRAWNDVLSKFLIDSGFQKGLQVNQFSNGIFINQLKYILDISKRFGMENSDTVPTPMVEQAELKLDLVGKLVDHTDYRSMIGSLIYVTSSRPDIMFATCMCARYQGNPNEHHVSAVKRIFRYFKGTINLGLWYPKDSSFDLTAYSDADHVGCYLDRK
nr:hypothetical protein [Tanacetum cinerariifolium]